MKKHDEDINLLIRPYKISIIVVFKSFNKDTFNLMVLKLFLSSIRLALSLI